jgi:hypothetical protein
MISSPKIKFLLV